MEIERSAAAKVTNRGHDWRAEVGARTNSDLRSISRAPVNRVEDAKQTRQNKSRLAVGGIFSGGCSGRFRKIGSYPPPAAWLSSHFSQSSPGSQLSYRCMGSSPTQAPSASTCPFSPGFLPGGVLQLIAEQITLISRQGSETLGTAFAVGLLIALGSANSGMAALFDALNVVYDEREKRSLVRFYATTFLFTLAGIVFVIVAITGVVVLPLMLKFVGLATTTEWLLAILRWPILFVTLVVSLACIYRYGPSRRGARWRWVTWGSILGRCYGSQPPCCSLGTSPPSTATTQTTAPLVLASVSWSGCGSQR